MALFRDLVRTIAEAEGLSEMAVTGVGQYLRDAGLISKHGRGKAAAHMTCEDAAHLIIGVNATTLAKDAQSVVLSFKSITECHEIYPITDDLADEDGLNRALYRPKNPIDCLARIIDCYTPNKSKAPALDQNSYSVFLTFGKPAPRMELWIGWQHSDPEELDDPICVLDFQVEDASSYKSGDRSDKTTITEVTLAAVGRVITR